MAKKEKKNDICPPEQAKWLINPLRKLVHNPKKMLKPYFKEGMTILDIGCGPGYFSIGFAKLFKKEGNVIAADIQSQMLVMLKDKIKNKKYGKFINIHQTTENELNINTKVDFIFSFFMIHEVKQKDVLFKQMYNVLKDNGKLYIAEPKFHVFKENFNEMIENLKKLGFEPINYPKVFFSRTVVLKKQAI